MEAKAQLQAPAPKRSPEKDALACYEGWAKVARVVTLESQSKGQGKGKAAEQRARQLQREASYERAISWARLTSASAAACCYFTVLFMLSFISHVPLPTHIAIGTDLAHSSSCRGLLLLGPILACMLCRRFINYVVKFLNEPNWIL